VIIPTTGEWALVAAQTAPAAAAASGFVRAAAPPRTVDGASAARMVQLEQLGGRVPSRAEAGTKKPERLLREEMWCHRHFRRRHLQSATLTNQP